MSGLHASRNARRLEQQGRHVAVVTNDQGEGLVDTIVAGESAGRVAEVTGGCFCCPFEDLLDVVAPLVGQYDVVLAEAVGSCTDLQATVVRPLQQLHGERIRVAPLLTVLDPDGLAQLTTEVQAGESDDLAYLFERRSYSTSPPAVLVSGEGNGPTKLSLIAAGTDPSVDLAGGSLHHPPHPSHLGVKFSASGWQRGSR
jgi:hypothetical protein